MFILLWALTGLSIVGVILNIYKIRWCFYIWSFTNFSWMIIDYMKGIYAQAFLFFVYFCLAIFGIIKWHIDEKEKGSAKLDNQEKN